MSTTLAMFPLLQHVAPRLARRFFTCKLLSKPQSAHCPPSGGVSQTPLRSSKDTPFLRAFRFQSTSASSPHKESQFASFSKSFGQPAISDTARARKNRFFPTTSSKAVAYWLLGSAASVYGIVVFGGLTRLTESGLSITEWRPVTGTLPPTSTIAWNSEFAKYKASPEFQVLNPRMELDEFKKIYYMEYIHRVWGRVVGLTFVLPTLYFVARRRVSARVALNLAGISGLIGLQGFVGWWMVKSGLKDDLFASGAQPRVSQYRLATHLSLAFAVYVAMLWNGITILTSHKLLAHQPSTLSTHIRTLNSRNLRLLRTSTAVVTTLIAVTAFSGALVAGLDAGLIYNEFPYMGVNIMPPTAELLDPRYARHGTDLLWRNMCENPSLAQLDHRILATTTFAAVHALWAYTRFSPALAPLLTRGIRAGVHGLIGLVWVQVVLGISTLIYLVPLPLASAHQAGALALLTGAVVLNRRLRVPKGLLKALEARAALGAKISLKGANRA